MITTTLLDKLTILGAAAKYDVSGASSGVDREGSKSFGTIGNSIAAGICHSFTPDGRCVSLLKVLQSNDCVYDCKYCVNKRTHNTERATFTPREISELTYEFYRRNYIEGLFLSSAVCISPDNTMEMMCETLRLLRNEYGFNGYIHIKAIPGSDPVLIELAGRLADRMSVNVELPTEQSLSVLAPQKKKTAIFGAMKYITERIDEDKTGKKRIAGNKVNEYPALIERQMPLSYGTGDIKPRNFVPGGQSTQLIIGATPDSDYTIMSLAESMYDKLKMKRVYYSAYIPVNSDPFLPAAETKPPLLREHRLYQADFLLRFYDFKASELLNVNEPNLSLKYDPKCDWAIRNIGMFPIEVNKADYTTLLRIPGIGVTSAKRIIIARKLNQLGFDELKKLGVVLRRAQFFITCKGKTMNSFKMDTDFIIANLSLDSRAVPIFSQYTQLSLFDTKEYLQANGYGDLITRE